jgi:phosphoadenosine phosphosulfate reductase
LPHLWYKKGIYTATDIRPVFPEENLLLSLLLTDQPFTYQKDSVWYGSNSYIVNGKKVKLSVTQLNKKPIEDIVKIKDRILNNS